MRKTLLALACLLSAGAAHAQEFDGFKLRPFAAGGLTYGGDKIDTVYYTNSSDYSLRAGNLLQIMAGLDARLTSRYALQFNFGYQVDYADGDNGSLRFERVPLELIGYFYAMPNLRFGVGPRWALGARVAGSGVAADREKNFKTSLGAVLEGEYFFSEHLSLRARYVAEKYEPDSGAPKLDGDHFGLLIGWYF